MPTIQVSTSELFHAVERLAPEELDQFIAQVMSLRAKREPIADTEEARLLEQIGRGVPDATVRRYDDLVAKRRSETLTAEEHRELLRLTEEVERWSADRVGVVVALAGLRGAPPEQLLRELGVRAALPSEQDAQ